MTALSKEMQDLRKQATFLTTQMINQVLVEVEAVLDDPQGNIKSLDQSAEMLLDLATLALALGMDASIARKLEDMSSTLRYMLGPHAFVQSYRTSKDQLLYVLNQSI